MKLQNKKTGEIREIKNILVDGMSTVNSLAELNEEWEDYEEPKEWWYIDIAGEVKQGEGNVPEHLLAGMKQIGNYFSSQEAEKAVEKLKAWKRLKDKGFRFNAWYGGSKNIDWEITSLENESYIIPRQICDDLDLLFSQEDN